MSNRTPIGLAVILAALPLAGLAADEGQADPVLAQIVREALARSREYAQATASLAAEQERIVQAGALPDPTLTLGIQNDGFQ